MAKKIYNKEEFMEKVKLDLRHLDEFIKTQILKPAGKVDGSNPYFDESSVEVVEAIVKLLDMGYSMEEVIKIRRKVGLPKKEEKPDKKDESLLTVGELAKRIDSNPRTIKHWEEKGIIEPTSHSPGGFRLYHEGYVQICLLLQDLQNFGYTLDEIKVIADLVRDFMAIKNDPNVFPADRIRKKFDQMNEQLDLLNSKMGTVENGIRRWRKIQKQHQKEMSAVAARYEKQTHKDKKRGKEKKIKPAPEGEPQPA